MKWNDFDCEHDDEHVEAQEHEINFLCLISVKMSSYYLHHSDTFFRVNDLGNMHCLCLHILLIRLIS